MLLIFMYFLAVSMDMLQLEQRHLGGKVTRQRKWKSNLQTSGVFFFGKTMIHDSYDYYVLILCSKLTQVRY